MRKGLFLLFFFRFWTNRHRPGAEPSYDSCRWALGTSRRRDHESSIFYRGRLSEFYRRYRSVGFQGVFSPVIEIQYYKIKRRVLYSTEYESNVCKKKKQLPNPN